jgi:uncharacterized protein
MKTGLPGAMIYEYLGHVLVFLAGAVFIGSLLVIGLVYYMWRTNRTIMPKTVLILLRMFEWPVKAVMGSDKVDKIMVEVANRVYERSYRQLPYEKRVVFLPQCLRNPECPAKLSTEGIICVQCGKCPIGDQKKVLEHHHITVFIVPGASFITRMLKKYRYRGVVGVGCMLEIKEGMSMVATSGLIPQGIPLQKDGCVATTVKWNDIKKRALEK